MGISKEEADRLIAPGDMVLLPGEPAVSWEPVSPVRRWMTVRDALP